MAKHQGRKRAAQRPHPAIDVINARVANSPPTLTVPDEPTLERWVERYRAVRRKGAEHTSQLLDHIPTDVINQTAQDLGIVEQGVIVFESDCESSVLLDHALHYAPRGDVRLIESYFRQHPPPPETADEAFACGFLHDHFVLCLIVERIAGFGVEVRDLLTDEPFLVADFHLSQSVHCIGLTLAGRIRPLDDFWMFSGAMVPVVHAEAFERISQYFDRVLGGLRPLAGLPAPRQRLAESFILRTCLEYSPFERMGTANV